VLLVQNGEKENHNYSEKGMFRFLYFMLIFVSELLLVQEVYLGWCLRNMLCNYLHVGKA
jgi:hypothetical protein